MTELDPMSSLLASSLAGVAYEIEILKVRKVKEPLMGSVDPGLP